MTGDIDAAPRSSRRTTALVAVLPVAVLAWVVVPRVAVNRAHYGLWELLLLATGVLAVPGTYALIGLVRRAPTSPDRQARRWLWSADITLIAFVVVLSAAGPRCCYPDDRIPGLTAGLCAGALAGVLTVVGVVSAMVSRLGRRRADGS
jgi:hypothetical protein